MDKTRVTRITDYVPLTLLFCKCYSCGSPSKAYFLKKGRPVYICWKCDRSWS